MELILSSITTVIVNLIVFSLIPFVWWFCRYRKKEGFFQWIGIYKPQLKSKWWVLLIFAVLYSFFYNFDFTQLVDTNTLEYIENSSSVSVNAFAGLGAAAILPALIENFIANGVAEEVLFRGFLCKRFCAKLGSVQGIILQAVLFGLMHNVLYVVAGLDVGLWYLPLLLYSPVPERCCLVGLMKNYLMVRSYRVYFCMVQVISLRQCWLLFPKQGLNLSR